MSSQILTLTLLKSFSILFFSFKGQTSPPAPSKASYNVDYNAKKSKTSPRKSPGPPVIVTVEVESSKTETLMKSTDTQLWNCVQLFETFSTSNYQETRHSVHKANIEVQNMVL